jgi:predicted TIM-barrel fold metal-dependent hydrolase
MSNETLRFQQKPARSERTVLPLGACDCHVHVFGPADRFPFDPHRVYTPSTADVEELKAHMERRGLSRVVIVQPSVYGTDNRCVLDALRFFSGQAVGVAVVNPALGFHELETLHDAGIRGVRINLETAGVADPEIAASLLFETAHKIAPLGWHIQIYTNLDVLAALKDLIQRLPVKIVIDHFGMAKGELGVNQRGFGDLLELVSSGNVYVKLSMAERLAPQPDDMEPFALALIEAGRSRMLWASDWPHSRRGPSRELPAPFGNIDEGLLLSLLVKWCGDAEALQDVLVNNPASLYRL